MTSTYHSRFSPFPIDLNHDAQHLFSPSSKTTEDASSSSSSFSYPIFNLTPPAYYHEKQAENIYTSHGGSCDHPTIKIENRNTEDQRDNNSSVEWKTSKIRLMRRRMTSNQTNSIHKFQQQKEIEDDNNTKNPLPNNTNSIRVCADCNTTKTPLWRSGPRGPKSLCNACGIRQRKARRAALAAAQASENGTNFAFESAVMKANKVKKKQKKTSNNNHLPFKKRCKFTAPSRGTKKQLCLEDLSSIILSKNSAFQQVFPQDEKEAAILLMALSYGLDHG